MKSDTKFDPGLSRIMVICLSLAFVVLICSMESLRVTPTGFSFEITWRTALAVALGSAVMAPCFYTLVYSGTRVTRAIAKVIIAAVGITGFFYPIRFVPRDQMHAILSGLVLAICAIGTIAIFIYLLHRALERDTQEHGTRPV
jgi:hypothetical protein